MRRLTKVVGVEALELSEVHPQSRVEVAVEQGQDVGGHDARRSVVGWL